jgi:hypothetical protein
MPHFGRKVIVRCHCHHQPIMGFDAEEGVLNRLVPDFESLDSGCCLAGSFGFQKESHAVSKACVEWILLTGVKSAGDDTSSLLTALVVASREVFSGRKPLHLAEVIAMGLESRNES